MKTLLYILALITTVVAGLAQSSEQERLAKNFEAGGDLRGAARLYLELYEKAPDNQAYFDGVVRTFQGLQQLSGLLPIVTEHLVHHPSVQTALLAGTLSVKLGKSGTDFWNRALEIGNNSQETNAAVAKAQEDVFLLKDAINSYRKARDLSGSAWQYARQLQKLYAATGDYRSSVNEIFTMVNNTGDLTEALGLLAAVTATDSGLKAVDEAMAHLPSNTSDQLRLKLWHLQYNSKWPRALTLAEQIDDSEQAHGQALLQFADAARKAEQYDVALSAYSKASHASPNVALSAAYGSAQTLEQKLTQARTTLSAETLKEVLSNYQTIVDKYPTHPLSAQALLRIGQLQLTRLHNSEEARETLSLLANRWPGTSASWEGMLMLADIYYALGQTAQVADLINRVEGGPQEYSLIAKFKKADYLLFEHELGKARVLYQEVSLHPASLPANDAIERLRLILLSGDDSLAVSHYIRGLQLQAEQKHSESANSFLQAVHTAADPDLADQARIAVVQESLLLADTARAVQQLDSLIAKVPSTLFGDKALLLMADILTDKHEIQSAVAALTTLLVQYPNSIYTPLTRELIRKLRGDIQ